MTTEEEGVFSSLIGHDGAKAVMRSALRLGDVHINMSGPPASGKSVALLAIEEKVPGAKYKDAKGFTETQLRNLLGEDHPILLLDEIDAMKNDAYDALPVAMEQGVVTKDTAHEQWSKEISTQIFAACNDPDDLPAHVADRFRNIQFEPYSFEEFQKVCGKLLPEEVEWVETEADGKMVAVEVHDAIGTKSPRDARDAAKLAGSVDRVPTIAKAMNDASADVDSDPLTPEEIANRNSTLSGERDALEPRAQWERKSCDHLSGSDVAYKSGVYRCPDCADADGVETTVPVE